MKNITTLAVVLGIIALLFIGGCSSYNGFVDSDENVSQAWANVESAYQRRSDLIPNLVNTVKGSADFERGTLTEVIEARAKATSINVDANNLTPEAIEQFQQAQAGLSSSLGRLLVSVERYPELRSTAAFVELQTQLEGTENRIKVERDRYNEAATVYNKKTRRFPGTVFASIFGFDQRPPFKADEGAATAPTVDFN
ncbi:MAG: LemA family protein [Saprospiraceae bacterium]